MGSLKLNNSVFVNLSLVNGKCLTIGSHYSAPSSDLEKDFEEYGYSFPDFKDILIGGDLNVHLKAMGYAREDARTDTLLDFIMANNLFILNDPDSDYTWLVDERKNRPDLTLGGTDVCNNLASWSVDTKIFSFSDHRFTIFKLDYKPLIRYNSRFKTKNKSFVRFICTVERDYPELMDSLSKVIAPTQLDSWLQRFYVILDRSTRTCFRRGNLSYKPKMIWFTGTLRMQRNRVNALYKRMLRNLDEEEYRQNYKTSRLEYKKAIKAAKKDAWLKFCEQTNTAYSDLYKFVSGKKLRHTDLVHTTLEDSEVFDTETEVTKALLNEHFKVNQIPDRIHEFIPEGLGVSEFSGSPITYRELRYAVQNQHINKAPGYDDLDPLVIKNLCKSFPALMLNLFNRCMLLGYFPTSWKKGIVVFFRKKNKNPRLPRSYRPITLLPVMGKIFERIIKTRILITLEKTDFLNNHQHGFREGRSTLTALVSLKKIVQNILFSNKYCSLISLDIEGAFDAMSWDVLSERIDALPIEDNLKSLLKSYISKRKIGVKTAAAIVWYTSFMGCPLGSCLGPLLWTIIADIILKHYYAHFGNCLSYADDFVILGGADSRNQLENVMNERIDLFRNICLDLRLTLSINKTLAMMFGKNLLEKRHPIFKLGQSSIPVQNNITYLGFVLDPNFRWLDHFDAVKSKLVSFTLNMKKTGYRDKGLSANYLKIWYRTVL